jgi:hypothetical protein
MAVCLLCTCAKESLPWPIEDLFIVTSHLAFIVQPYARYGTKAGRKTRSSLARSARDWLGSARLGSLG